VMAKSSRIRMGANPNRFKALTSQPAEKEAGPVRVLAACLVGHPGGRHAWPSAAPLWRAVSRF
jgi:hypothetical protein